MDYHRQSIKEKLREMSKRQANSQHTLKLNDELRQNILKVKNTTELNDQYAYKQIELYGRYDHGKSFHVETLKDGVYGFNTITPFLYQDGDNLEEKCIFVDLGFMSESKLKSLPINNNNGYLTLKGFVAMPHFTKDTKQNDYVSIDITTMKLDEFCNLRNIKDDLAKKVFIKAVHIDTDDQGIFPLPTTLNTLNTFNTSIDQHNFYKRLFAGIAFLGLYGNLAMWVAI